MPDDPIVIDDGGSTRIKRVTNRNRGNMDSLMDVDDGVPVEGRAGSTHEVQAHGDGFNFIRITRVNSSGGTSIDTMPFQEFEIRSGDQRIIGRLVNNAPRPNTVMLTLHGPRNNEPSVVAKNQNRRRRYIVENAPPIDHVFVDNNLIAVAAADTVYTTVVVGHVDNLSSI